MAKDYSREAAHDRYEKAANIAHSYGSDTQGGLLDTYKNLVTDANWLPNYEYLGTPTKDWSDAFEDTVPAYTPFWPWVPGITAEDYLNAVNNQDHLESENPARKSAGKDTGQAWDDRRTTPKKLVDAILGRSSESNHESDSQVIPQFEITSGKEHNSDSYMPEYGSYLGSGIESQPQKISLAPQPYGRQAMPAVDPLQYTQGNLGYGEHVSGWLDDYVNYLLHSTALGFTDPESGYYPTYQSWQLYGPNSSNNEVSYVDYLDWLESQGFRRANHG